MRISPAAGLGLKVEHFDQACAARAPGLWFEVHAENHLVDGGPRLAWLEAVRAHHPVSLHGVALSLGGAQPLCADHLRRLGDLVRRIEPVLVSEHLAWSRLGGQYAPDLLPVVRSHAALRRTASHVQQMQDALQCRMSIENPSHYLNLPGHDWEEVDFLHELARRTGCGLLVDVNNVHVSACNLGLDAAAWIDRIHGAPVLEVHLAGHHPDPGGSGLLIDSHNAPVSAPVWALYERLIARIGARPTLIERDNEVPAFDVLMREREQAQAVLHAAAEALTDTGSRQPAASEVCT